MNTFFRSDLDVVVVCHPIKECMAMSSCDRVHFVDWSAIANQLNMKVVTPLKFKFSGVLVRSVLEERLFSVLATANGEPHIVSAQPLAAGLLVTFSHGKSALFPASFLRSHLPWYQFDLVSDIAHIAGLP